MQRCTGCKKQKPDSAFSWKVKGKKRYTKCAQCRSAVAAKRRRADPERYRKYDKAYRLKNWDKERNRWLLRNYGITLEEFNALLKKQKGKCAICRQPPFRRQLDVDHCHQTDIVRGLLCTSCNRMLGHAKDSIKTLMAAISYLKAFIRA